MSDRQVRIAVVGLGNMGLPMASRLIDAGFSVAGFDVDQSVLGRATEAGVRAAATTAEAVRDADGVILMLPNSDVVESVLRAAEVRGALSPESTVVDMSSSEPLRTRALAEELSADGVRMVDAPVSGGVKGARAGTLTIMLGGADDDVARVRPWLEPMGTVVPTGEVGSGHAMKALNNLLSATHLLATAEAMLAGERLGLDPGVMLSVFNRSSGKSGSTENKFPNFILSGTYDSGFALRLMLKDMRIALGIAEATGAPHELATTAVELWGAAAGNLEAGADHTEIDRWVRSRLAAPAGDAR